jgi:hypothetical protein
MTANCHLEARWIEAVVASFKRYYKICLEENIVSFKLF